MPPPFFFPSIARIMLLNAVISSVIDFPLAFRSVLLKKDYDRKEVGRPLRSFIPKNARLTVNMFLIFVKERKESALTIQNGKNHTQEMPNYRFFHEKSNAPGRIRTDKDGHVHLPWSSFFMVCMSETDHIEELLPFHIGKRGKERNVSGTKNLSPRFLIFICWI
jgi:hypothetical protein